MVEKGENLMRTMRMSGSNDNKQELQSRISSERSPSRDLIQLKGSTGYNKESFFLEYEFKTTRVSVIGTSTSIH